MSSETHIPGTVESTNSEMRYAYIYLSPDSAVLWSNLSGETDKVNCRECPLREMETIDGYARCSGINNYHRRYRGATLSIDDLSFREELVYENMEIYFSELSAERKKLHIKIADAAKKYIKENGALCADQL